MGPVYCRSVYLTLPPLVDSLPQSSVVPLPPHPPPLHLPSTLSPPILRLQDPMDKYYTPQPFANPPSLDDELAHDPGNSTHWSVPHPTYGLAGPVDAVVYQPAQLAYPESSQRTLDSSNAYLYYGQQVRATPHTPQQLPRETYDLGQGYYTSPYVYPAFASLGGSGTYEGADAAARDEGTQYSQLVSIPQTHTTSPGSDTQSTHSLPSQQGTTQSGYVTSHCSHTPVTGDEVGSDSIFFEPRRETQFGSPDSVKDGSDDGKETVRIRSDGREG